VNALQADVQLADAQLEFAKITAERWESAAPNGAVSKQERDAKNAEYKTAQAKHAAAKAQLALGEATVKRLEAEESFKKVIAPFDGVITQRKIDIGSLITAGSTSSTSPLFAIVQANKLRVYVKVPQTAAPEIAVGMTARVTTRELPGKVFTGTVDRTAGAVDQASRTLKVEVLVPNPKLALLPGMYARVAFETARAHPPLLVQAGALDLRPEGPTVAVVDAEDRVHFRKIKVAQDLGDAIEVAEGLRPDDWVGLNVSDDIADGERVQPVRVESPPAVAPNGPAGPRLADTAYKSNALAEIH
jgi:RND family efflux transporter MFP subunit